MAAGKEGRRRRTRCALESPLGPPALVGMGVGAASGTRRQSCRSSVPTLQVPPLPFSRSVPQAAPGRGATTSLFPQTDEEVLPPAPVSPPHDSLRWVLSCSQTPLQGPAQGRGPELRLPDDRPQPAPERDGSDPSDGAGGGGLPGEVWQRPAAHGGQRPLGHPAAGDGHHDALGPG